VTERWVLNASPLIVLARVGQEHLFRALADDVVVPRAVVEEIEAGPADDRARQAIAEGYFAIVDAVPLAKQRRLILSAADVLRSLLEIGFHLDERIIREALSRTVGEKWE
jgi:predicted nucleic acid-binding protein